MELMRSAAGNQLVLSCLFLADTTNLFKLRMVVFAADPLHKWHQNQQHMLRTASGAEEWLAARCRGEFVTPLVEMLKGLRDPGILQAIRVSVNVSVAGCKQGAGEDLGLAAQAAENDYMCSQSFRLVLSLVGARMRRYLNFLCGYPYRAVLFLNDETRHAAIDDFRQAWQDHEDLSMKTDRRLRHIMSRSLFALVPVRQLVEILKGCGWRLGESPAAMAWFRNRFKGIGASQYCEDGFHHMSAAADAAPHKFVSQARAWAKLLDNEVASEIHKFRVAGASSQGYLRNVGLPDTTFRAPHASAWVRSALAVGPRWGMPQGSPCPSLGQPLCV